MTVPAVPNRSLEHLERGALPFRAFPLPLGGNVGNALHNPLGPTSYIAEPSRDQRLNPSVAPGIGWRNHART
jgi:hypothetical protein